MYHPRQWEDSYVDENLSGGALPTDKLVEERSSPWLKAYCGARRRRIKTVQPPKCFRKTKKLPLCAVKAVMTSFAAMHCPKDDIRLGSFGDQRILPKDVKVSVFNRHCSIVYRGVSSLNFEGFF